MRSLTFDLRFRLGRTLALAALLGLAVPGLLVPRAAQAEPEQTSARKFQRGLAGLTLGALEVPGNIAQEGQTNGALLGLTVGLGVGLGKALVRTLVGAYELLSAPFPAPAGFEPMLQPEFPWEYFDSEPGRPYGFEATYLAAEEGTLKRIPGAQVERRRGALTVRFPGDLLFESESAELSSEAEESLKQLAEVLRSLPESPVFIKGFTDATGAESYNLDLSRRRAAAVRSALIAGGVPSARIDSEGYGPALPLASNATAAGRRANRRAEIEVRASGVAAYR